MTIASCKYKRDSQQHPHLSMRCRWLSRPAADPHIQGSKPPCADQQLAKIVKVKKARRKERTAAPPGFCKSFSCRSGSRDRRPGCSGSPQTSVDIDTTKMTTIAGRDSKVKKAAGKVGSKVGSKESSRQVGRDSKQ